MEPDELRAVVGHNVRRLAWQKGISLNRLADFAGIYRSGFIRAVNGKAAFTTDRLAKIASALGVTPVRLLEEKGAPAIELMAVRAADAQQPIERHPNVARKRATKRKTQRKTQRKR